MEHLIRLLSWSFVFGAIATLLYTNFKPSVIELLSAEVPVESVQGSAVNPERPEARSPRPAPTAITTTSPGNDPARRACIETEGSQGEAACGRPSS